MLLIVAATRRDVYVPGVGADSISTLAPSTTVAPTPVSIFPITNENSDDAQHFALALEDSGDDGSANDPVHDVVIPDAGCWQDHLDGVHYSAGWQGLCRVPHRGLTTMLARGPPVLRRVQRS